MSIKVLVVLSLITVAASSPAPILPIRLPGISVGGNLGGILGIKIGSLDLGKGLRDLFGVLIGQKHTARNELEEILNLKVSNFNDVCTLLSRVVVSLSDTIEASITGLGNLLSRVIISLLKIVICILGGAGGNNPICGTNVNLLVGVQASATTTVSAVINLFGVGDCKARLNNIISIYTKGRGISACRGSVRTIFTIALNLVNRLQVLIDGSGSLVKGDFKIIFRGIIGILGSIGNSRQKGLGLKIAKNFVDVCNKFIIVAGYPGFGTWADIQIDIDAGNDDNAPWAISDLDASVNAGVSLSIGGLIGNLFKGLLGVTRLAVNLIQDILKIVINSVDAVFNLALKIILGLGGVLDATISGLGSLLVRIVAGLLKIVLCFIGAGKYGVCSSSWERQVGVSGSVTSIDLVIQLYGLVGCRAQVDKYISVYTNGAGIGSTSGSVKILLQSSQTLADIIEAKQWTSSIVVIVFRHITYLLGAIGNSNARGVGTAVCNKFIPACNKYLTDAGYPGFGIDQDAIIQIVEQANNDSHSWTADIDTSDGKTGFIIGGSTGISVGGTGLIGGLIKGIFGTISGVVNFAVNALNAILTITIRALNDVFSLIFNLSLVLQVTLNNLVAGLGSLFVRLVAVIIKIAVCILGLPGDKGVCVKGWNSKFGINGEASTAADLIILFRVNNAEAELNDYIIKLTNGKGISSTNGSVRTVLEKITTLVTYVKNYNQISRETVTETFIILTTVSGCISNSRKTNSGKEIVEKIVPECGKYFKQQGYPDITVKITIIAQECSSSNGDNVNWDGSGNGSSGNNGGTGGNNGGNNGGTGGNNGGNNGGTGGNNGGNNGGTGGNNGGNNGGTGGNNGGDNGGTGGNNGGNNGGTGGNNGGNNGGTGGNNGGDNGGTGGNNGGDNGGTGGNNGGNNGGTGGNNGGDHGGTGGNNGGNNGGTGGNNGGTGGNNGGDNGGTGGNNGGDNGGTGGNNGGDNGGTGGNNGGDNGGTGGNNGGHNGGTGGNNGGDNGGTGGNNGGDNGGTGGNNGGDNGGTGGNNGGDNGGTGGNNGGDNGGTGGNNGGDNGGTGGNNGGDNGGTGGNNGGDNGGTGGNNGGDNGGTGGNNGGHNGGTGGNNGGDNGGTGENNGGDNGGTGGNNGGDNGGTGGNNGGDNGGTGGNNGGDNGGTGGNNGGDNGGTGGNNGGDNGGTGGNNGGDNGGTGGNNGGDNGGTGGNNGGNNGGTGGNNGGDNGGTGGDNGNGIDFGITISGIIKLIPGVASISANIINEIIKIKINTIIGIINLVTKLAIALGGIIDSIISGLGSILIRIVAVIFKIGYCVNGWGPERSICTREWNAQFGITGEATTAIDLIDLYRLGNCKSDVDIIVSTYTNGKGISSTSGFINIVLRIVSDLSVTVSSGAITKDVFSVVFINVISLYGSITNSYKQGSGTDIIQKIIPVCGPVLQKGGFGDISAQLKTVVSTINIGNNDKFNWSVVKNGGDSISDKLVSKVKEIFKDVEIKNNVKTPSLTAILNIQPPNNFDDVCSFGVQVVQGLGGILDLFINGLGTLIARIVGALINYIVAILGAARNSKSFVSQKAYYASFGVSVSAKTWAAISAGFKINNAKADLDVILNVYTNNKGLKSLSGIKLVLFNAAYTLVKIVAKGVAIVESDLTTVFRVVTTIIGGFANSISVNVGKTICDNLLPTVSFYLEQNGYLSLGSQSNDIYTEIETCNNSDAPWARGSTATVGTN